MRKFSQPILYGSYICVAVSYLVKNLQVIGLVNSHKLDPQKSVSRT